MKKSFQLIVLGCAFIGLGLSMPSCPGQQAMQQQIDGLQAKNTETTKQLQTLSTKFDQVNGEISKMNAIVAQLNTMATEQKQATEMLQMELKALKDKMTPPQTPKKGTKSMPKKKGH